MTAPLQRLADRPEVPGKPGGFEPPAPSGRERGKRAKARLTIPKKNSGRDFNFPPRPSLKRPKEGLRPSPLETILGGTGDF